MYRYSKFYFFFALIVYQYRKYSEFSNIFKIIGTGIRIWNNSFQIYTVFRIRIRMDPGFLPIRIRVLKVRILPLRNLWDLQ